MAKQLVPDELWMIVGIIFVLKSGIAPEGIGLWQRGDVLKACEAGAC